MTAQRIDPDLHPLQMVRSCVAAVGVALDGLPPGDLPGDGRGVDTLICDVVAAERRLVELRLGRVAEEQAEAAKVAASGTDAWLAHLTGTTRGAAAGGLWLARMLAEKYDAVRVAFARGELSLDQARVIVRAAEKIPATVSKEHLDAAVADVVAKAVDQGLEPGRLRRTARRMLDTVDPAAADAHQRKLLNDEEKRAAHESWFQMHDQGDGTWAGRFVVSDLHARLLAAFLAHLTSPRRLSRTRSGEPVVDETAPDNRGWSEKQGAAFAEMIEHLPTDGHSNHGRVGATVMVHLDYQHLIDGLAAAGLDTGGEISAGQARRLACGAGIIPAVLGTDPMPLDLGRETRLHTKHQRAALSVVHDTCAAEGCHRPFAWTEIHHIDPWSHGGSTNLANAVPLCGWHHHRIHDPDYTHTLLPTGEIRYRRRRPGLSRPHRAAA